MQLSKLIGTSAATPYLTAGTRPLCPYPQVAPSPRTGSSNEAKNFSCVVTKTTNLAMEQDPLSLSGNRYFNTTIKPPNKGDWRVTSAVREGALAVKLTRHGNSYTATFKTPELKNIIRANAVAFTVPLFVEHRANHYGNLVMLRWRLRAATRLKFLHSFKDHSRSKAGLSQSSL